MFRGLKGYFSPSIHLFLWWFGGLATCVWCYFLILAAYAMTYFKDAPGFDDFLVYISAVTFCVGTRSVGKAVVQSADQHSSLHGEIWYISVLILTGIITFDHFSPWTIFNHVEKVPHALYWTNAGLASLFGVKVFKGWDALRKIIEKIASLVR